jgi:choline-sulfatase
MRSTFCKSAPAVIMCAAAVLLACATSPEEKPPNVLLVVVDAMRADHLGCYGYSRPTSPTMDSLAAHGVVFETAITQAPWTKSSFSSFLTSLYPFQHGVEDWSAVMPDSITTVAEVLSANGYSTLCVINMIGLGDRFGVLKGFDRVSESGKGGRDARATTDDAIALLENTPAPFFMLLHYFDVHQPYAPAREYVNRINVDTDLDPFSGRGLWRRNRDGLPPEKALKKTMLLYDGCIRYVDTQLARLLAYLEERGVAANTVAIVTADHGEAFWEHGVDTHGSTVYDEALKVPLIFAGPGGFENAGRVGSQVRLIDIFPTVLAITRAEDEARREGVSLLPLIRGGQIDDGGKLLPAHIAYAGNGRVKPPEVRCLRTAAYKVIASSSASGVEVYDLKDDPGEKHDLAPGGLAGSGLDEPAGLMRLLAALPAPGEEGGAARTTLTDEEKNSLRALGYMQ